MKKIWKYIVGFFTFLVGILALSGKKNKRVKEIKSKLKDNKSQIKDIDAQLKKAGNKDKVLRQSLESTKKGLKEIEKSKYKKKDVGAKEASDFLKKYAKGKK